MTEKQLSQALKLIKEGYHPMIHEGPYIDGFATVFEENGFWMIESKVWDKRKLSDLPASRVSFYKRVDLDY